MRWPRISIVTPSYNQGKYIERTVRSVLFQRYPNLDYLLMDGGSTDDTVSRLAPYKDQFSCFVSEPDDGQADAIAKGFARSSGEIMAYLNSDDLLAPGTLDFVANFFERYPAVDCIYSHRCTVDENDAVIWYWILPPHHSSLMKRWDFIPQETCFWRRSLFEKAGNVDPSYHFAMDYDLFVRFMNLGRVRRINRFLGAFRQHSESKTTQQLGIMGRREMLRVRQKYGIRRLPRDGFFGNLLSQWVNHSGRLFASSGRKLPGAMPGVGYDYNDYWGGILRLSDFQCEQNKKKQSKKKSPFDPVCPVTLCFPDRLLFSVTSTQTGRTLTSDIYVKDSPRTAIILPSLGELWRKPKNKIRDEQITGAQQVYENEPDLSGEAASEILELTHGLISEGEEIAFLEIGCHTGKLLDVLTTRTKWKLSGLEAVPSAAKEAILKGHRVLETTLEEAPGHPEITKCFDVIYLGHGIERFNEPRVSLRSVALLLNQGGLLILSTPNVDSEQLKQLGPAWAHWKSDVNRFIYSKKSLKGILSLSGFDLINVWTVSSPAFRAGDGNVVRNGDVPAPMSGKDLDPHSEGPAETASQFSRLLRNRFGEGDVMFAISRRVS